MTMAMADRAKTLRRQGVEIVDLSAGEPDFETPEHIKQAAIRALEAGRTKYTKNVGIDELRAAVCQKLARDNDLRYRPEEIIISNGGKHVLFNAFMALLNPGDELIIFAPYWVTFPAMATLAGATPVIVDTRESRGYEPQIEDVRRALTDRTKAILINSPGNPTGAVYSGESVEHLYQLARDQDLFIISDECYDRVAYEETHTPPAVFEERPERVVTVQSVSKPYAMTGWRIGYGAASTDVIDQMAKIQSQSTSNANSIAQYAAVEALTGDQAFLGEMVRHYRERRDFVLARLAEMPGVECATPRGAFYVFPKMEAFYGASVDGQRIENSLDLANFLLETAHVVTVPGAPFGADAHIRLSYATSMKELERGMTRMQTALKKIWDQKTE